MNARSKLNQAYLNGSLVLAAVVGLLLQSWIVFGIALVLLVGINLWSGGIRLKGRNRP